MSSATEPSSKVDESTETLGLKEAAELFGVSVDTLRRRIKSDSLPEATLEEGKFGSTWVIPVQAMGDIATRERWVLDLDVSDKVDTESGGSTADGSAQGSSVDPGANAAGEGSVKAGTLPNGMPNSGGTLPPTLPSDTGGTLPNSGGTVPTTLPSGTDGTLPNLARSNTPENLDWVERLLGAETRASTAEAEARSVQDRVALMTTAAESAERRIQQLTRDLEHERTELRKLRADLVGEEKAKAVAQARTEELRGQLERERTDLEGRLGDAKSEADAHRQRAEALSSELGDAQAAMGWWSRRKFEKTQIDKQPPPPRH